MSFQDIQYEPDDESFQPSKQPKPRLLKSANRDFKIFSKHHTPEDAFETMKQQGSYSKLREYETKEGIKVEYSNQVKLRGLQCASSIQLLYHSTDTSLTLFKTINDHTHDEINQDINYD